MTKTTSFTSFATTVIVLIASLMLQIGMTKAQRLPEVSHPFPQWAYWNPIDDTILVSNGKTMQLYTSDFYLLRDIRLVPEDIDADRERGLDLLFGAVWHPTGQWIRIQDLFKMEIWNSDLTTKLYTSPPQGQIDERMTWHSQEPWLALTSYDAPIHIFNFVTQRTIATREGWVITGVAWWPGTDKVAFTDNDGFTVWDVVKDTVTYPPLAKSSDFIFNRSGTLLADTDYGDLVIFRTDTWQQEMTIHQTNDNSFYDFAWVGDNKIAGLDITQNLSIWDISTQKQISSHRLPKTYLGMSWNASGSQFLVISREDITVRDTETGEIVASLKAVLDGRVIPSAPTTIP